MNREQMKRAIFQNDAGIGNDQPVDPTNRFYNPHLPQRPSADIMMTLSFESDAPWNESKWQDPKSDSLLAAARSELDLKQRTLMYWDMQAMIRDGSGIGIPLSPTGLTPIPTD
jgi:ABC-type transport system substrate-binding protein